MNSIGEGNEGVVKVGGNHIRVGFDLLPDGAVGKTDGRQACDVEGGVERCHGNTYGCG